MVKTPAQTDGQLKMPQSGITDRRRVQFENPLLSLGGKCNHVASN